MFHSLGDAEALAEIRDNNKDKYHCPWLRRDANACECMPDDVEGIEVGSVCPHNAYAHHPEVFARAEGVIDTVEYLFRLVNSAEIGFLSENTLDPLSVTELLTARHELDRQSEARRKREYDAAKLEAEANKK